VCVPAPALVVRPREEKKSVNAVLCYGRSRTGPTLQPPFAPISPFFSLASTPPPRRNSRYFQAMAQLSQDRAEPMGFNWRPTTAMATLFHELRCALRFTSPAWANVGAPPTEYGRAQRPFVSLGLALEARNIDPV